MTSTNSPLKISVQQILKFLTTLTSNTFDRRKDDENDPDGRHEFS